MAAIKDAVAGVCDLIRSLGTSFEDAPKGTFSVDFYNTIIGDPYLDGTGWLPDRQTAEGVAAFIIPVLNELAMAYLEEKPDQGSGWVDPEGEAQQSYVTIISAARKDDDPDGDPVIEEVYYGDDWFIASMELKLLTPEQQATLDKVRAVWPSRSA